MSHQKPFIQFVPKHEAEFSCPSSDFERFKEFLKNENVTVSFSGEDAGTSNGEQYLTIEVQDVDDSEAERLIAKYKGSLRELS